MKKNKSRSFIRSDKYPGLIKALKILLAIYTIFIIVFKIAIGRTLNFQTYESFYNCRLFPIIILLWSLCIFILGIIVIVIYNKDLKVGIFMLLHAFSIVALVLILSSGGVSLISWTKDLHYALMNNPPSITDELKEVNRNKKYIPENPSRRSSKKELIKNEKFIEIVELKIGDKTFIVDDVGNIKEFLDTYKKGTKVKAVYMPESNILISLEDD